VSATGKFVGALGVGLVRALGASWRYRDVDEQGNVGPPRYRAVPAVYVIWHQHMLMHAARHRREGLAILSSPSRDGRRAQAVARPLGFEIVLGSSSRGATAGLRAMVRVARAGRPVVLTADGPRGPARHCKPGSILIARLSGRPIVPAVAVPRRAHAFDSWDRFLFPYPMTTIYFAYGPQIHVPADDEEIEPWMDVVQREFDVLETRCERAADRSWRSK
jgi:lysophospholipid acyltransferase (LPLAT)-like uncharacterized protein